MRALDLFAGCGGASVGLRRAGLDVVADYERDADACATLAAAGLHPVRCDLAELSGCDIPAVELWWASPPCQPFSAAGKRAGQWDDRDGYPHVLRLLEETPHRPTWLLVENVAGLLHAKHATYWRAVQAALRRHFAWVEWRLLDAADYGVPQHRRRVITVCGPCPIVWPTETHGPGRAHPYVTMGEALGLRGPAVPPTGSLPQSQRELDTSRPATTISAGSPTSHHAPLVRVYGGGHNPSKPGDRRAYADLTDRPSTTIAAQHGGGAGNAGPWIATRGHPELNASPNKPSPTLRSGGNGHSAPGMYVATGPLCRHRASEPNEPSRTAGTKVNASVAFPSPTVTATEGKGCATDDRRASRAVRRRLTVDECLVLQDLAGHPVQGATLTSRYRQAGNAVPPRLAEVVARAVLEVGGG